jgi:hypothetical protein
MVVEYVPVISKTGKPLMPCHPARARQLMHKGKAVGYFNHGKFCIRLTEREDGDTQSIAVGIDPGSKKEAFTVKSATHTYLNIQADAVTWVKGKIEIRRNARRSRRSRNTPCRQPRFNRKRGGLSPSTKARWGWKLRICKWLSTLYPIEVFVVEDIRAFTKKGKPRWNKSFSPLENGKHWFYTELSKIALVITKQGYDTYELRQKYVLQKSSKKLSDTWDAHCVDSWVLANWYTGGHIEPDNKAIMVISPIQLHRRQLHKLQPESGGIRKPYGGTCSMSFKRGSLVKHPKYGLTYVGGTMNGRISLHSLENGKRLSQNVLPEECIPLAYNTWKIKFIY